MAKQQLLSPCWTRGRGQSALRRSVLGHYQGLAGGRGVDTPYIERSLILKSPSANISDCLNFKMSMFSDDKLGLYGLVHKEIDLFPLLPSATGTQFCPKWGPNGDPILSQMGT